MLSLHTVIDKMNAVGANAVILRQKATKCNDDRESDKLRKASDKEARQLQSLQFIKSYLETNPRKEFLEKEKERIENRLNLLDKELYRQISTVELESDRKAIIQSFNKTNNVPNLKAKLSLVKILLADELPAKLPNLA